MNIKNNQEKKVRDQDKNNHGRHDRVPERGQNGGSQDERRREGDREHNKKY